MGDQELMFRVLVRVMVRIFQARPAAGAER
jgi:hypothetical protein